MDPTRDLEKNLNDFNKLSLDLANSKEDFTNEHKTVILLNSLPNSYKEVKNDIEYDRDSLTTDMVISSNRSKNFETKTKESSNREGLMVRGRL